MSANRTEVAKLARSLCRIAGEDPMDLAPAWRRVNGRPRPTQVPRWQEYRAKARKVLRLADQETQTD